MIERHLYAMSTAASIEAEQARRRNGGRYDADGSGLQALSDDDLRIWLYGVRHREHMARRFDGITLGISSRRKNRGDVIVNAVTGRPLYAFSPIVDMATGKALAVMDAGLGGDIKYDASLPLHGGPKQTPCVCTARGSCSCPPGHWPTGDELLRETMRQARSDSAKETTMKNDSKASENDDYAKGYAEGVRSGSSRSEGASLAAVNVERMRGLANPARFDLFGDEDASPEQPGEDRIVTRMAELTFRACATRGADMATTAEKEELLRLEGRATHQQIDRAKQIARDRRAGVPTVNRVGGNNDNDPEGKKIDALGAPRSTYWAGRGLAREEAESTPLPRYDTNGGEHPVTKARREHLERMRGLHERGGR